MGEGAPAQRQGARLGHNAGDIATPMYTAPPTWMTPERFLR
jgi:hypothetical protein